MKNGTFKLPSVENAKDIGGMNMNLQALVGSGEKIGLVTFRHYRIYRSQDLFAPGRRNIVKDFWLRLG